MSVRLRGPRASRAATRVVAGLVAAGCMAVMSALVAAGPATAAGHATGASSVTISRVPIHAVDALRSAGGYAMAVGVKRRNHALGSVQASLSVAVGHWRRPFTVSGAQRTDNDVALASGGRGMFVVAWSAPFARREHVFVRVWRPGPGWGPIRLIQTYARRPGYFNHLSLAASTHGHAVISWGTYADVLRVDVRRSDGSWRRVSSPIARRHTRLGSIETELGVDGTGAVTALLAPDEGAGPGLWTRRLAPGQDRWLPRRVIHGRVDDLAEWDLQVDPAGARLVTYGVCGNGCRVHALLTRAGRSDVRHSWPTRGFIDQAFGSVAGLRHASVSFSAETLESVTFGSGRWGDVVDFGHVARQEPYLVSSSDGAGLDSLATLTMRTSARGDHDWHQLTIRRFGSRGRLLSTTPVGTVDWYGPSPKLDVATLGSGRTLAAWSSGRPGQSMSGSAVVGP